MGLEVEVRPSVADKYGIHSGGIAIASSEANGEGRLSHTRLAAHLWFLGFCTLASWPTLGEA
jgi:hypothetical protein